MRSEAEAWFRARLGAPLPTPPDRRPLAPFADPLVMLSFAPPPDAIDLGGIVVWLVYRDEARQESQRAVRCGKMWRRGEVGYLMGFCELRQGTRRFRIDHIEAVIVPTTGELIEAGPFFSHLGLDEQSVDRRGFFAALRRGAVVLVAAGRADGHLVEDEMEAVYRWAERLSELHGIELDERALAALRRWAVLVHPTADDALDALMAIREHPEEVRLMVRAVRDLAHSDDHVSIEDVRLMEWLGISP